MSGTSSNIVPDPSAIGQAASPAFLRLPDPQSLFGRRAARFAALAPGNPLEAFLKQLAALADAQRLAMATRPTAPDAALDAILARFDAGGASAPTRATLADLRAMPAGERAALTERVRQQLLRPEDVAPAWFVAAALQVSLTTMAAAMPAEIARGEQSLRCPCCAGAPVASVLRAEGNAQAARYLVCGLCAAEWHLVRITCAHCGSTKDIAYHGIEGANGAVRAETCDACGTYTKIFDTEKDNGIEPLADDLASIALDILVDEAGWRRAEPNPFLLAAESAPIGT